MVTENAEWENEFCIRGYWTNRVDMIFCLQIITIHTTKAVVIQEECHLLFHFPNNSFISILGLLSESANMHALSQKPCLISTLNITSFRPFKQASYQLQYPNTKNIQNKEWCVRRTSLTFHLLKIMSVPADLPFFIIDIITLIYRQRHSWLLQ